VDEGDDSLFCTVDGRGKYEILCWLATQNTSFKPTFARIFQKATKDFSAHSIYPSLGVESTLPQYRATNTSSFSPSQNEYPLWYLFYGTLAIPEVLARQLNFPAGQVPVLQPGTIKGGMLETWAGKYRVLVDAPESEVVNGSAYLVESKEHEDALRVYETDNYEVVRCEIYLPSGPVMGCSFRFVGTVDGLVPC